MIKLDKVHEACKIIKKYEPEILCSAGIYDAMVSMTVYTRKTPMVYWSLYKATREDKYLAKYYRITKSNNWLKMHGYPLRRKLYQ